MRWPAGDIASKDCHWPRKRLQVFCWCCNQRESWIDGAELVGMEPNPFALWDDCLYRSLSVFMSTKLSPTIKGVLTVYWQVLSRRWAPSEINDRTVVHVSCFLSERIATFSFRNNAHNGLTFFICSYKHIKLLPACISALSGVEKVT